MFMRHDAPSLGIASIAVLIAALTLSNLPDPSHALAQTTTENPQGERNAAPTDPTDAMTPVKVVRPFYPKSAELAGLQGRVTLAVTIARNGSVSGANILSGNSHFYKSAIYAVLQWEFRPSEQDSRVTIVTIYFSRNRNYAAPPAIEPVTAVRPEYPLSAKMSGLQGMVSLLVKVEKDGSVSNAEPLSGDPMLAHAAIDAVRQWRFAPLEKAAETDVSLNFTLPNSKDGTESITPPLAIYQPEPAYNRQNGKILSRSQGMVKLNIMISTDGSVGDVKVTKPLDPTLDDSAVQTVKTWKFLPALKAGTPIPYRTDVAVSFRLF